MNPSPEDIRIGKMAALADLIATCESDIGQFKRHDLTEAQNEEMQKELCRLFAELIQRRIDLICHRSDELRRLEHTLPQTMTVDYWCRDCQDWFRSERTPVHAPATKCPKCRGTNTYEAYVGSGHIPWPVSFRADVESGFD